METAAQQHFPVFFPVYFALGWLTITTFLSVLSGWFFLMRRYPNRKEKALLQLRWQSGSMGLGVSMHGILNLAVCPSGLRIGVVRIFGVFCRDFLVPWQDISVTRKRGIFGQRARLQFGDPPIGSLTIYVYVADRLARASLGNWPEAGSFLKETATEILISIGKEWILVTSFAAAFFIVVPRIVIRNLDSVPIWVAILFPGVVFGISCLFQFFRRIREG